MDFSYFTSAPQPYNFFTLPPTPATSSTPQPEDFTGNPSDHHYDAAFAAFQQNFHYDPNTFLAQPHQIPPQSPTNSMRHNSVISLADAHASGIQPNSNDISPEEQSRARSSSEEKEGLTPAQSRRKAQNRAAQRAFRERKERHVKDLEAKLTTLQHQSASLNGENERLKRELAKVATENEILRATTGAHGHEPHPFAEDTDNLLPGPLSYSPTDLKSKIKSSTDALLRDYNLNGGFTSNTRMYSTARRILIDDETGEPLLAASATWDYIQAHELFRKGLVDVGDVCERLKKMARCDGQGPVFEEGDVRRAIAESAVAGEGTSSSNDKK